VTSDERLECWSWSRRGCRNFYRNFCHCWTRGYNCTTFADNSGSCWQILMKFLRGGMSRWQQIIRFWWRSGSWNF